MKSRRVLRFLPAMLVLPVWLTIALREDLLAPSFRRYYPLAVAMAFGSMIAGSTPLGGGVVAFPVSVLTIGFAPSQGRDFSLMIQSCGMTAASFLVLVTRSHLPGENGGVLAMTCLFNVFGLIVGEFVAVPPFVTMCIYTTSVACFALILAYVERCRRLGQNVGGSSIKLESPVSLCEMGNGCGGTASSANRSQVTNRIISAPGKEQRDSSPTTSNEECTQEEIIEHDESPKNIRDWLDSILIASFALVGGFISSKIGTGADMTWYAYGSLIYNSRRAGGVSDNDLTALSIIVMTVTSIFGTILRASATGDEGVSPDVYHAFVACACIVVLGAPLGSLLLSAGNQRRLKLLFYVLAFAQLVIFGAIKIRDDAIAWCVVGGTLCAHRTDSSANEF